MTAKNALVRAVSAAGAAALAAGLVFFFRTYTLDIPQLRFLLLAMGAIVAVLAAVRPAAGATAFLVLMLTANHGPYFFGVEQSSPQAPTAIIFFLFFILGWTAGRAFAPVRGGGKSGDAVSGPLLFAAAVVAASAVLTIWKWMNFFPLRSTGVYDLMTNGNGLPAGAARSSALFGALTYLAGFALFGALLRTLRDKREIDGFLRAAVLALLAASLFGLVQRFIDPGFGNTGFWIFLGQINGTFKDPNAFAGVLTVFLPVLFGLALDRRGPTRVAAGAALAAAFLAAPAIGARSWLAGLVAGAAVFAVLALRHRREKAPIPKKKVLITAGAAVLFLAAAGSLFIGSELRLRLKVGFQNVEKTGNILALSRERYFLWKHALAMTRDYPLTGVGMGAYLVELPDYFAADTDPIPAGFENYRRLDTAESLVLQIASELGLIGLLAFGLVAAGIVREIRRGITAGVLRGPDRHVYLGAAGGMAGFGAGSLFHSYAQSFETLFSFWIAAALVVLLGRMRRSDGTPETGDAAVIPPGRSGRAAVVLAALGVLLFAGVHLRNSARELSIPSKTAALGLSQHFGLYRPETDEDGETFQWTRKEAAWTVDVRGRYVHVPVSVSNPDILQNPLGVKIFLARDFFREEIPLGEALLTEPGWKVLEFRLPEGVEGPAMIRLVVDRTWIPREVSDAQDGRRLGVAVGRIRFWD